MTYTSDSLKELAPALAKAQGRIEGAKKDSNNPHFKSKYADLASHWEAFRGPLTENNLSLIQHPSGGWDEKRGSWVGMTTLLLHGSGEFICFEMDLNVRFSDGRNMAQELGSMVTYLRRYCASAVVGTCPEDDDGNASPTIKSTLVENKTQRPPIKDGPVLTDLKKKVRSYTNGFKDKESVKLISERWNLITIGEINKFTEDEAKDAIIDLSELLGEIK